LQKTKNKKTQKYLPPKKQINTIKIISEVIIMRYVWADVAYCFPTF
jgi:hypothetical protein